MKKKVLKICSIFIIISILVNFLGISLIYAETLNEQKKKTEKELNANKNEKKIVRSNITKNIKNLQELKGDIQKKEAGINELEEKLKTLNSEVKTEKEKLEDIEKSTKKLESACKERLSYIYENNNKTSIASVMMKSTNIMEFLNNYYLMQELNKMDFALFSKVDQDKAKSKSLKQELETKGKLIEENKVKIQNEKKEVEKLKTKTEEVVKNLNEREKKINANIQQLEEKQRRIENEIVEEMRRAEIERLRRMQNGSYQGPTHLVPGGYMWPLPNRGRRHITAYYGDGYQAGYPGTFHSGIDIGCSTGTKVYATKGGEVIMAGYSSTGYGKRVMIYHGGNMYSLYGHGSKILVKVGQIVNQGDLIMLSGNTGNSTGPHLHFEMRKGIYFRGHTNPLNYVSPPF